MSDSPASPSTTDQSSSAQATVRSPAGNTSAAASTTPATSATTSEAPAFGWSVYAERINGRFAMLGFVAVLLIEALSGDTFLHWAGLVP